MALVWSIFAALDKFSSGFIEKNSKICCKFAFALYPIRV